MTVGRQHPTPAVDIRDLDVTFATDGGDVHAVAEVTLDVRRGEVLAIVGESGSGQDRDRHAPSSACCPRPRRIARRRRCSTAADVVGLDSAAELRGDPRHATPR